PAGAGAFSSPIMSGAADTFNVTVTVAGNYRYLCSLHSSPAEANAPTQSPTQMVGQFTVVGTAIPAGPIMAGPATAGTPSAGTPSAGTPSAGMTMAGMTTAGRTTARM